MGDGASFTLNVTNNGPDPATGINITDLIPSGFTYNGYSSSISGSYNSATGLWTVGTLNDGASAWLTLTGTVNNAQAGNYIVNHATETNNEYPFTVNIPDAKIYVKEADVTLSQTGGYSGNTVTFNVTASNSGPDTATNVTITDTIPSGLTNPQCNCYEWKLHHHQWCYNLDIKPQQWIQCYFNFNWFCCFSINYH